MKKKLRKKWIKALKSGDYEQATGQLKTEDGYCCLGVLADITKKKLRKNDIEVKISDCMVLRYNGSGDTANLIPAVRDVLEISDDACQELSELNDSSVDFKKVIKAIKRMELT